MYLSTAGCMGRVQSLWRGFGVALSLLLSFPAMQPNVQIRCGCVQVHLGWCGTINTIFQAVTAEQSNREMLWPDAHCTDNECLYFFGVMGLFITFNKNIEWQKTKQEPWVTFFGIAWCPGAGLEALENPELNSFDQGIIWAFKFSLPKFVKLFCLLTLLQSLP